MKHTFTVQTARRAGYKHRKYGYVIKINPPIKSLSKGFDIEGVGFVPHFNGPQTNYQHFFGWYKHKDDAAHRAEELSKSDYYK